MSLSGGDAVVSGVDESVRCVNSVLAGGNKLSLRKQNKLQTDVHDADIIAVQDRPTVQQRRFKRRH